MNRQASGGVELEQGIKFTLLNVTTLYDYSTELSTFSHRNTTKSGFACIAKILGGKGGSHGGKSDFERTFGTAVRMFYANDAHQKSFPHHSTGHKDDDANGR